LEVAGGIVAVGTLAFAPFNFPKARLFLGDVGSYFLGGWLGVLAILCLRAGAPLEAALAPFAIYLADAGTTLVKRIRQRRPLHQSHREHAYQRLVIAGWSHAQVTVAAFAAIALCSVLGLASLRDNIPVRAVADGAALAVTAGYLALPAVVERSRHGRLAGRGSRFQMLL
jgi:UDP-N-acetylmuramyl pentapeptide phosphotransferase/UDP-N-acetylglucosamine-1-phosphate transferase